MKKQQKQEVVKTVLCTLIAVTILQIFVIQSFWIPSESMQPTIEIGDRVLVCKFMKYLPWHKTERGDIIVFTSPLDPRMTYIKRVVGLPGERIEIRNGTVYINDVILPEKYVINTDAGNLAPVTIPADHYFCMGDNRPKSNDSRMWGYVPSDFIKGPAVFRYWPLSRVGVM